MLGSSVIDGEVWHCSPLLLKPVCIAWCCDLNVERERERVCGGVRDKNTDVRKLSDRWRSVALFSSLTQACLYCLVLRFAWGRERESGEIATTIEMLESSLTDGEEWRCISWCLNLNEEGESSSGKLETR